VALTTGAVTANRLYAFPFICPKQITLDRIAINVTTLLAGNARLGIYNDSGNCYPGSLILDAGAVSTGTIGIKSLTISQSLTAGLKWLVLVASAAVTLRSFAITGLKPILGWDNTLPAAVPGVGYYVSFTYAALPATYPTASPTVVNAVPVPAVFVRLSA
jgi:hypothetical protein